MFARFVLLIGLIIIAMLWLSRAGSAMPSRATASALVGN